jgi:hypothetical protein
VKDRVKLLAMVTHQHFTVSDSHALLGQHVVASDVKCYWSDGLMKNALFDNILYTINKFYFDIDL